MSEESARTTEHTTEHTPRSRRSGAGRGGAEINEAVGSVVPAGSQRERPPAARDSDPPHHRSGDLAFVRIRAAGEERRRTMRK